MVVRSKLIFSRLDDFKEFPVLPGTYFKLIEAIRDNAEPSVIAKLAERDVSLTLDILKMANSSYYRSISNREIGNLEEAIIRLGMADFERLVSALSIIKSFNRFGSGVIFSELWHHSYVVANMFLIAYKHLSDKELPKKHADNLFTAGLLHDVGILLLDFTFPKLYEKLIDKLDGLIPLDLANCERELLGVSHDEVGVYLAKRWSLPTIIQDMIGYHHDWKPYRGQHGFELKLLKMVDELTSCYASNNLKTIDRENPDVQIQIEDLKERLKIRFISEDLFEKNGDYARVNSDM